MKVFQLSAVFDGVDAWLAELPPMPTPYKILSVKFKLTATSSNGLRYPAVVFTSGNIVTLYRYAGEVSMNASDVLNVCASINLPIRSNLGGGVTMNEWLALPLDFVLSDIVKFSVEVNGCFSDDVLSDIIVCTEDE
jgi:hypothetical protein